MSALKQFRERLGKAWMIYGKRPLQLAHIHRTIEHLHGPLVVPYEADELIALCLLRDGELYVNSFVQHYTRLGVKHIFFMDNGSTDQTVALARQYPNVTILRSTLPFRQYKMALRHYLIRQFAQSGRWALYVDADEFFDYPFSDRVGLAAWLGYLRQRGYTTVLAQMLDMFPDAPLNAIASQIDDDLPALHRFYDLSGLVKADYYFPNNALSSPELKVYHGGVRRDRLSVEDLGVLLSKHPLFFLDGRTKPLYAHEHSLRDGVVADVTAVLYHYKFLQNFSQRAHRAVAEQSYNNQSEEYKEYLRALEQAPDLNLRQSTACELHSTDDLVENQFLYASPAFMEWAARSDGMGN
jgi:glycosyltransferase involved in cell wall biosynthesis